MDKSLKEFARQKLLNKDVPIMPLVKFNGRAQAIVIILAIAVMAIVGLLLLMAQLAESETSATTESALIPSAAIKTPPNAPGLPDLDDAVATVNNQIITQQVWQQATRLDAVMSQLAAQPIPTAEETLDRLINEIIVLEAAPALTQRVEEEEIEARIQALVTSWSITDEKIVAALAAAGLKRSDLTVRVKRLMQVEAALNQLATQEDDLKAWLTAARASAEIGLYRSLVSEEETRRQGEETTLVSQSPQKPESEASLPSSAPAPPPVFAPPSEMAVSPYPESAAPDFTLTQLDGSPLTLSDLRGKPILINFWATWCPPCRRELPALQAAYTVYRGEIGFIAVNVKEDPATVTALAEELGLNFPIVLDPDGQISDIAYEVRGLPTTVFVDANGVVAARHVGPLDEAVIDTYLAPLLEAEAVAEAQRSRGAEEQGSTESPQSSNPPAFQPSIAPDFSLTAATGGTISLQDYRDKSNVALVFYRGHT
jgi:peroxiredoxin